MGTESTILASHTDSHMFRIGQIHFDLRQELGRSQTRNMSATILLDQVTQWTNTNIYLSVPLVNLEV